MENYHRDSYFDQLLGYGGEKNVTVQSGHGIHWAYGDSRY